MIAQTLWHIESAYRLTSDVADESRDFNIFLASTEDITQVAQLVLEAVQFHVSVTHENGEIADLRVDSVERKDEVYMEGDDE